MPPQKSYAEVAAAPHPHVPPLRPSAHPPVFMDPSRTFMNTAFLNMHFLKHKCVMFSNWTTIIVFLSRGFWRPPYIHIYIYIHIYYVSGDVGKSDTFFFLVDFFLHYLTNPKKYLYNNPLLLLKFFSSNQFLFSYFNVIPL